MHELSLACSLIEEAENVLEQERAGRVVRLTVGIGRFAGIDPGAFSFAFPCAAAGTRLADAVLTMQDIPAAVRCRNCGRESHPDFPLCACAHCGSADVEMTRGRELVIQSMEIIEN